MHRKRKERRVKHGGEVKEQRSAEMMECNDSLVAQSQSPKTSGCRRPDDICTN